MEQPATTGPISTSSPETARQEATAQIMDLQQSPQDPRRVEIRCFCGLADDDGNLIACERCSQRQHVACYYPDQENETLGGDFRHVCVKCAPPVHVEDNTDDDDDDDDGDSEYEYTSGYSQASAAASQFGEASTDGHHVPDVFLYMTQDVPPPATADDNDTLRVPPVHDAVQEFREQLFALSQIPLRWEDPKRLDQALTVIPLDHINEQAQKAMDEAALQRTQGLGLNSNNNVVEKHLDDEWGYNDYIIIALMNWFKQDFFTWETNSSCPVCSSPTKPQGETAPTAQEREDSALVVELYACSNPDCGASERFPRYSDPWRLLETRRGRLAEWANCFGMLCRAVGARVRWTWNADKGHIWLEVYSDKKTRWVSVDIFEVAWDKPLLYTEAWGQKMSYCIAFSADGPADVTRRYVRRPDFQLPRRRCSEAELEDVLLELRRQRRAGLVDDDDDDRSRARLLEEADEAEEKELSSYAANEDVARGRTAFKRGAASASPSSPQQQQQQQAGFFVDKGKGIAVN